MSRRKKSPGKDKNATAAASPGSAPSWSLRQLAGDSALGTPAFVILLAISTLVFLLVLLRNAWVCDDAYITFRSVEQLFAGHGPVWNPHERVQAFTHPLWYGVLAAGRIFSRNLFLIAIAAGLFFSTLAVVRLLWRFGGRNLLRFLFLAASVLASQALMDFSTAGLENSLLNFLLVLFWGVFLWQPGKKFSQLVFLAALVLLCRHDVITLLLPALLAAGYESWRASTDSLPRQAGRLLLAASPLLAWTLFSLFYYGFPFPNTAYAKLHTGVLPSALVKQGFYYLANTFQWDPYTLLCIVAGIVLAWFSPNRRLRWISVGLVLNILYVLRVGGDFMAGRFWVSAFWTALILLASVTSDARFWGIALGVVLIVLGVNPHSPLRFDPVHFEVNRQDAHGIADEKSFYFTSNSLASWRTRDPWRIFPDHPWAEYGAQFRASSQRVDYLGNVGMSGYFAGPDKIIVDGLALTDPFLAGLPAVSQWRIGHFPRVLPDGYLESVKQGRNLVTAPRLAARYDRIVLITQGPLFSVARLKAILAINTGG
jgi:arabinofuranosyltransferase